MKQDILNRKASYLRVLHKQTRTMPRGSTTRRSKIKKTTLPLLLILSVTGSLFLTNIEQVCAIGSPFLPKTTMISQWKALCDAHPQYASYENIGKTVQGQNIWMFKIGTPSGGKVMYDGQCHGTEDSGTEVFYHFTKWMLESNDPTAQRILERNYHLFIPIVNMDNSTNKPNAHGVDLNRNGIYGWGQSGSSDPSALDYRGPSAGSEPETQILRSAWQTWQPKVYVNTHHGYYYINHVSNTGLEQQITSLYQQKSVAYGSNNPYSISTSSTGGYLATDADMSFGTSGWLWELERWQDLVAIQATTQSPTVASQMLMDQIYDDAFPLLLSFAEAVEVTPSPIPNPTPTPHSDTHQIKMSGAIAYAP
jgi:hypothetical protein